MPHKKLTNRRAGSLLSEDLVKYFEAGEVTAECYFINDPIKRKIWKAVKDQFLKKWIAKNPGTRPWGWWEFDAPEPRRRIGGIGTPNHEVLSYVPNFEKGIPSGWVTKFDEEYYNGRRKDIHGKPIGTEYKEGDFKGKAIDPNDPPVFVSEASYLQKHGFLTDAEKRFVEKHSELLEPEEVVFDEDED